ncbi:MAG TPA: DNA-3-methyladenine glycosylase [Bacillales bacterium]
MWEEKVVVDGPYDFDRALRRLAFDPLVTADLKRRTLGVPLWIEGKPVVAEVKSIGSVGSPRFLVASYGEPKEAVLSRLTKIFKWDKPLGTIAEHFALTDLRPLFQLYRGNAFICEFSVYRALMKSIVHQQLNMRFANVLTERFTKTYGFQQQGVWFYPQPEKVAEIPVDELRKLQFSQRKAEYVTDTAKMIVGGQLSLDGLRNMDDDEALKTLVKIRGVGSWTAESVLLFGMGREDLLPAGDVGIQNAVKSLYGYVDKPKLKKLRELGEKEWSPFRSYASLYLWESLGNHSVKE